MMYKTFKMLLSLLCIANIASTLSAQAPCNMSVYIIDSTSCNFTTVQLNANTQGGTFPFTFLWDDGSNRPNRNPVPFGATYSVTVTDANGCMATRSMIFGASTGQVLTVTSNILQPACNANGLGATVEMLPAGGTPPYSYYWYSSNETTQTINGISGFISGYITDAAGCYAGISTTIGGINYYGEQINESSCSQNNGSIQLNVQGNYTYLWSNGQTNLTATGLAQGAYGLTITDAANNCELRKVYQVGYNPNCESVISGIIDINQNCVNGASFGYNWYRTIMITNTVTNQNYYVYADQQGFYEFRTLQVGSFMVEALNNNYNNLTVICPSTGLYTITTNANGGSYPNNDFYLAYPNNDDLTIDLYQTAARVGFSAMTYVNICNQGNNTQSGTLTVELDPILTYTATNPYNYWSQSNAFFNNAPVITNNSLVYTYAGLNAGECFYMQIQSAVPQTVALGTTITSNASITPIVGDATPLNNVDTSNSITVNSYDPNDKQQFNYRRGNSLDAEIFTQDTELNYLIRFQNTGNASAIRVEVRDMLEANLLIESMRNIITSHPCVIQTNGQEIKFVFDNIYLADSFSNEPASHGFIKFTINRTANLPLQTAITNSANIYFDFNAPVLTNTQITTIVQEVVAAEKIATQISLSVMPNPVKDVLNIQYNLSQNSKVTMSLVNAVGQITSTIATAQNQNAGIQNTQISTANLPAGIYYLYIQTETGNYAHKIVKE